METTVELKGVQEKQSKAGRTYHLFMTDAGPMTCFESGVVEKLKLKIGQMVTIEYAEANGFKNIKKVSEEVKTEKVGQPQDKFKDARMVKNTSYYTSYAKDLFIGLIEDCKGHEHGSYEELMKQAIELTKMAIDSFE